MTGSNPVYFYNFSYVPSYPPGSPLTTMGAAHGFELGNVFAHGPPKPAAKDELMLQAISTYWTNFAKTGNPNGPGLAPWPEFTRDHQRVMNLGDPIVANEISTDDLLALELLDSFYAQQRQLAKTQH